MNIFLVPSGLWTLFQRFLVAKRDGKEDEKEWGNKLWSKQRPSKRWTLLRLLVASCLFTVVHVKLHRKTSSKESSTFILEEHCCLLENEGHVGDEVMTVGWLWSVHLPQSREYSLYRNITMSIFITRWDNPFHNKVHLHRYDLHDEVIPGNQTSIKVTL